VANWESMPVKSALIGRPPWSCEGGAAHRGPVLVMGLLMSEVPKQLPWKRFVHVLHRLGYQQLKARRGSTRLFSNPTRNPNLISLRQPHPGDTIHPGALYEFLHRLQLSPDEFTELLRK